MTAVTIENLNRIYGAYLRDMSRSERARHSLGGAFGSLLGGAGSGADSCNDRFAEELEDCLERFNALAPSSEEAAEVMRYVISRSNEEGAGQAALLMLNAAEGLLIPLAERLQPEAAGVMLGFYNDIHPDARLLLPSQIKLCRELKRKRQA